MENQLDSTAPPEYNGTPAYSLSTWKGYVKYCCTKCKFDTLHRDHALDHFINIHLSDWRKEPQAGAQPTRQLEVVLYDADNRQITEVEVPVSPGKPLSDQEIDASVFDSLLKPATDNKPGAQAHQRTKRSSK